MTPSSTLAAAPNGDAVRAIRAGCLLTSVIPAKPAPDPDPGAGTHASLNVRTISETAPTSKRVVGARLRGHDVVGVEAASPYLFHPCNESLSS
jgi:hypothetical protein